MLVQDIKLAAKQGNQAGARILAQQLVRLRNQMTKMRTTQAQLRGVGVSMTVSRKPLRSTASLLAARR
jgi:charged multivesicular body protein 2A/charged multivesicular body protein 2B